MLRRLLRYFRRATDPIRDDIETLRKRWEARRRNEVFHIIRYLPPGEVGSGELVTGISAPPDTTTLKGLRKSHPQFFTRPGFYTLAVATGETMTVRDENA